MARKAGPPKTQVTETFRCANGMLLIDQVKNNIEYYADLLGNPDVPHGLKRRIKTCIVHLKSEGHSQAAEIPARKLKFR